MKRFVARVALAIWWLRNGHHNREGMKGAKECVPGAERKLKAKRRQAAALQKKSSGLKLLLQFKNAKNKRVGMFTLRGDGFGGDSANGLREVCWRVLCAI